MTHYYSTLASSFGEFSVAVDESGAVIQTAFGGLDRLRPAPGSDWQRDDRRAAEARAQLAAYFDGRLRDFTVPLSPVGSPFQHRVWKLLVEIPRGQTRSYGDLARDLESSPRAVGRANATNPICVIVPCHRVIGADGSLTGFAFGEDMKRRLLEHEGALLAL